MLGGTYDRVRDSPVGLQGTRFVAVGGRFAAAAV